MNIQEAAASLLVPAEEAPIAAPANAAPVAGEEIIEAPDEGAAPSPEEEDDGRSEEQKLIDELAGEDEPEADDLPADVPPPPNSWSKDDVEEWKDLTPKARETILRREGERDKFIADTGRKAAEARKTIERQAMDAVAQHAEQYAQRLNLIAQQVLPQPPDARLLYSDDPNVVLQYQRQKAAYDANLAQHQAMQQEAGQAQAQANAAREEAQRANLADEAQRLAEQLPEWADPSARATLLNELQTVGAELGYPVELMAEAGATDILALKKALEWREKARKFDRIVGKRMETVRAAKDLPRMTRPGAGAPRGPQSANDMQANIERFNRERSPEAAAALLMTGKR